MTTVLERPQVDESDTSDAIVHRCCSRCWPLPGPAEAYCGVFKEWTQYVTSTPDTLCRSCKDPGAVRAHKHLPR